MPDIFHQIIAMPWLEAVGLASGLYCVWLLIRQNVWTFPIGLVYSVVSVGVFAHERLYADVLLSVYYVAMNAYGWYYWLYGGTRTVTDLLPVTRTPRTTMVWLAAATALATFAMGWFFDTQTNASLPYWDSATTCMSFAAMWMTARKYIENWIVWLVVDVMATVIYLVKGIELYAVLYGIYLAMAIMGWRAWQRSLSLASSSA
ncbi:MAG: nicotinamide riboside transporter PnuC [Pseudomonadales bacterium]|nr:nicotinamide mononucleotide transporter [Pseudomonadales bacterium]NIX07732.1 nicotinamide riboside transporter PnuC [Pseudomonadales bacterium]